MASRNRVSDPDSLPVNGTEQQQTDLFQNLEKLIASAVSICRLDGSVQCQIGGLITVIEELQRLLRHSFAEIKRLERSVDDQKQAFTKLERNQDDQKHTFTRLERNLDDQQHMFTNNITNLHYQVKEVQCDVGTLRCQMKDAEKCKETDSANQQNSPTVDNPPAVSLVDESYGYSEESDSSSIPNNLQVDNTEVVNHAPQGTSENDKESEIAMDTTDGTDINETDIGEKDIGDTDIGDKDIGDKDTGGTDIGKTDSGGTDIGKSDSGGTDIGKSDSGGTDIGKTDSGGTDIGKTDSGGTYTGEAETTHEQAPSPSLEKEPDMVKEDSQVALPDSPPHETPSSNLQTSPPDETATSTYEERESVLRVLRSNSDGPTQDRGRNNSLEGNVRNLRINAKRDQSSLSPRQSKSPFAANNRGKTSPKNQATNVFRKGTSALGKHVLIKNAAKRKQSLVRKSIQRSPPRQITPKHSRKTMVSKKSPPKQTLLQRNRHTKIQRKSPVGTNISRKSTGTDIRKNAKVVVKTSQKSSPLKLRNGTRHSSSPSKTDQSKVVSNSKAKDAANQRVSKEATANQKRSKANENSVNHSLSKESKESIAVSPVPENPMDKYINLDFLLNANQLMSELVADPSREEGTLDTASEAERRHIVDLAKLYRLRVRMAGKEGELPVALIKGRESSLPKPGQVDKLLHQMTRAMEIKTQIAKSKESAKKHKLSGSNRRSMAASPAKKRRF